jgi:hypothetical protein
MLQAQADPGPTCQQSLETAEIWTTVGLVVLAFVLLKEKEGAVGAVRMSRACFWGVRPSVISKSRPGCDGRDPGAYHLPARRRERARSWRLSAERGTAARRPGRFAPAPQESTEPTTLPLDVPADATVLGFTLAATVLTG